MIAVIIPTIPGREALYERTVAAYKATADERTVAAYKATADVRIITVRNRPTCGQAWTEGADAAAGLADIDYIHLAADDLEPHAGWAEAAMGAADRGIYPSPRILNADGSLHSCGTMGGGMLLPECATGTPCGTSPFPFMTKLAWTGVYNCPPRIGPGITAHYYADDFFAWRARIAGYDVRVVREFCFTHLDGRVGVPKIVARAAQDRALFLATIGVESPAPMEVTA